MNADPSAITLTRRQVRDVDRRAIEEFGIPVIVLMENAARNAAQVILAEYAQASTVAIVCGRGNNGGDGFAVARHLVNAERSVEVFLACDPAPLAGDAEINWRIVERMKLPCRPFNTSESIAVAHEALSSAKLIVDAVLGTGFTGEVRPPLDEVITAINAAKHKGAKVVAIDVPSGLDCDTGQPSKATVEADLTITFVARKVGFDAPGAAEFTGRVQVADIGAPAWLAEEVWLL